MHNGETVVQRLHFGTVRGRVITLLPIPRLLMFSLPHYLRCSRPNIDEVRQACDEHSSQRCQHV